MLENFFKEIEAAQTQLGGQTFWYRGHSCFDYNLTPSIFRNGILPDISAIKEAQIFYDYKMLSASIYEAQKSDWQLIFDMQHYGIPTRLLDWSLSLGTAIFFAIRNDPISPCIWVLSPHKLNQLSINNQTIVDTSIIEDVHADNSFYFNYSLFNLITDRSIFQNPIAILAPHGNKRMAAQRSVFTVHARLKNSIEALMPDTVRKIPLPLEEIACMKKHLENLGIDDFSLFPDNEGLTKFLLKKFDSNLKR